ncbi:MAG: hypothetical protein FJX36_17540 [Alphaproteobacteria bacterium]|nr:hypothetical protein [Alphaproteobacteria bacterium]
MTAVAVARWQDWDGRSTGHLSLREDGSGITIESVEHCHVNSLWSARRAGTIITVFGLARDALGR